MPNRTYNIEIYESTLRSEIIKLSVIAIILILLFVGIIIYSILQIKRDRVKKLPYIQLLCAILLMIFLSTSLGVQLISYGKDISEASYIQYEGPVHIRTDRQIVFGGIPTGYNEYIISFTHDGQHIELATRENPNFSGDIDKVYIVYSKHSNYIFEFTT